MNIGQRTSTLLRCTRFIFRSTCQCIKKIYVSCRIYKFQIVRMRVFCSIDKRRTGIGILYFRFFNDRIIRRIAWCTTIIRRACDSRGLRLRLLHADRLSVDFIPNQLRGGHHSVVVLVAGLQLTEPSGAGRGCGEDDGAGGCAHDKEKERNGEGCAASIM